MTQFQYIRPSNINELREHFGNGSSIRLLAGGTDLIPQLNMSSDGIEKVIDIKAIPEMRKIEYDNSTGLYIGAAVSCLEVRNHKDVIQNYSGIIDAISIIGGIQIQGRASIGGNLCNASPAADSIPALIVYNAICIISSPTGLREMNVDEFCVGPGRNAMEKDEFLVGIRLPPTDRGFGASYQRFIPRNEMDIAVVGVGVSVKLDNNKTITNVKIGLGAVAPTPLSISNAGNSLIGTSIDDAELEAKIEVVAKITKELTAPITDMRGSAEQRKHLVYVLTKREIIKAIKRARLSMEAN